MENGRQLKPQPKVRRAGKESAIRAEDARTLAKRAAKARAIQLKGQVLVNALNLLPTNSYGTPDFVTRGFYIDMPFSCKTCGKVQVWTATQQKWWYEAAKGDVWTIAVLCRPCRLRERDRKAAARKVHLDGLAKKERRET